MPLMEAGGSLIDSIDNDRDGKLVSEDASECVPQQQRSKALTLVILSDRQPTEHVPRERGNVGGPRKSPLNAVGY